VKKVCFFHIPGIESFHGYSIDSLDPAPYFPQWNPATLFQKLTEAKSIDQMYRERDRCYMRFLQDFVDKFQDADIILLAMHNPVHPEVLWNQLQKPIKVMGFIDDPYSTYTRGIPYLWAFDGAFYISPGYSEQVLFKEALKQWGCEQTYWWPLVWPGSNATSQTGLWPLAAARDEFQRRGDAFFHDRDLDVIYVGGGYASKMDRLAQLKQRFGERLVIHGNWSYGGYVGILRGLRGKPAIWGRVFPISSEQRAALYYRTKIGLNMHLSEVPAETGNMRMYEIPAHGMMQLCDKAAMNAHEQIFEPGKEAVFYDSTADAIEKIEYYLAHDQEREQIARAGFARMHRDYDGESGFKKLLDWAAGLPRKRDLQRQGAAMTEVHR